MADRLAMQLCSTANGHPLRHSRTRITYPAENSRSGRKIPFAWSQIPGSTPLSRTVRSKGNGETKSPAPATSG